MDGNPDEGGCYGKGKEVLTMQKSLQAMIDSMSDLPSMPDILEELFRVTSTPSCSSKDVARVLEKDQGLTAKLLRVANSPFYGLSRKVDTVERACTVLGLNTVKNMALSVSIMDVFGSAGGRSSIDVAEMWRHNLGCAVSAKAVFETRFKGGDDVFVGGILHDIGKIILDTYMQDEYFEVMKLHDSGVPLLDSEIRVLGRTHAAVGRILARRWRFPEKVEAMIAFHHRPKETKVAMDHVAAVHVGNEIAKALMLGKSNEIYVMPIDKTCWDMFFKNGDNIEGLLFKIQEEFYQIEDAFGLRPKNAEV